MRLVLATSALALCLLATLFAGFTTAERPALPETSRTWTLQPGDVVLRHGSSLWSSIFARLNSRDTRFSHAGIVVRDGADWYVIHAEADDFGRNGTVRRDAWDVFAGQARQLAVLRVRGAGAAERTAEAAATMHRDALPFDFSFDLTRLDAVYCSELVWRALREALQRDPLPHKPVLHGRAAVLVENLLLDLPELDMVYLSDE